MTFMTPESLSEKMDPIIENLGAFKGIKPERDRISVKKTNILPGCLIPLAG